MSLGRSVDDVDVYTGALSEYPVENGLLGGTLTCLLGDQFVRLKRGDRYWYETDQQPQAFTPGEYLDWYQPPRGRVRTRVSGHF